MAIRATVPYDTPGPKAQRFNRTLAWIVAAIAVTILVWTGTKLTDKGQSESDKWPSFPESTTWTMYILPGLISTIITTIVSTVLALVIGAFLGAGRSSPIASVHWLYSVIIEFFRAIPALVLVLFAYLMFTIW